MGRGFVIIAMAFVLTACGGSHRELRDEVPQTPAQTAAVDAANQCLVAKARAYDDGKISDKALAKLIAPLCEAALNSEHAAFTGGEQMTSRDVKVARKVDYKDALRAVLLERAQRRNADLTSSQR